jgi:peptidoglycan/LPS O-acetylase OafA/YrhL
VHRPLTLIEAFDPRSNSVGFLRWLMAFLVIFSHAGPLAGFYGGKDLGTQISSEQSLGGVAVAGFFFFSGFLITQSRRGRSTVFRYFWRRCLRIMPAFWTALLVTNFVLAPIAWRRVHGTWSGFWHHRVESPLTYVWHNLVLVLHQRGIAGLGDSIPYGVHGHDWNGSAWTLEYEFKAYIMVGLLGLFGILVHRYLASAIAVAIIVVNAMTWAGVGDLTRINPTLGNPYNAMLFAPFAFGMLFALWGDKIPIDDRLAAFGAVVAVVTYDVGGWNIYGQYGLLYVLMWVAIRCRWVRNWERFGDFSYGIYIFAWPLMQFAAYFGLEHHGWLAYHLTIVVAVHVAAYLSWHLVEKPAMSLKDWTPGPLERLIGWGAPTINRIKGRLVDPRFSSAPFASREATAPGLRPHRRVYRTPLRYAALWVVVAAVFVTSVVGFVTSRHYAADAAEARAHASHVRQVCRPTVNQHLSGSPWNSSHPKKYAAAEAAYEAKMAKENPAYVRGKDDWLFFTDYQATNFSQALGRAKLDRKRAAAWARYLNGLRKQAAAAGSKFYVVVAPAKWDVYPDKLPNWAQKLRGPNSLDTLMRLHPNLPFIDTRAALRSAAKTTPTYSPQNSHWTAYGAEVAWQQITRCLAAQDPSYRSLEMPKVTGITATADENEFAANGVPTDKGPVWTTPSFSQPLATTTATGLDGHHVDVSQGVDMLDLPATSSAPQAPVDQTLMLIRDSTGKSLSMWADTRFRRTIQVTHDLGTPKAITDERPLLATYHPDVTIFLMTERYLSYEPPVLTTTKTKEK